MTADTPFGFADEMRVGLRGTTRRRWGRRGVKIRQRLQLQYDWRYLFLVVDSQAGKLYWCWIKSMAANPMIGAVGGLERLQVLEALVWDGAPSHRDEVVQSLGFSFISLPPYSPELNPAERVFEELRRTTEGKVYATLDDKIAAVEQHLWELDADPERVRRLANWDWIKATADNLPSLLAA